MSIKVKYRVLSLLASILYTPALFTGGIIMNDYMGIDLNENSSGLDGMSLLISISFIILVTYTYIKILKLTSGYSLKFIGHPLFILNLMIFVNMVGSIVLGGAAPWLLFIFILPVWGILFLIAIIRGIYLDVKGYQK